MKNTIFLAVSLHDRDKPPLRIRVNSKYVMTPSSLTCLLAENLDVPRGSVVADLGCGCGILSIIAAKLGAKLVYAVDVNPHALSDTNFNARINGVSSIVQPVLCDITKSILERKVDVAISNPPQMPAKYRARIGKWLSISRDGGVTGRTFLNAIVAQSPRLFREKQGSAKLEFVTTSLLGIRATLNYLEKHGFSPSIVANSLTPISAACKRPSTKDKSTRIFDLPYVRSVVLHATYNRRHRGKHLNDITNPSYG
jgi:HemK-related putative methylase